MATTPSGFLCMSSKPIVPDSDEDEMERRMLAALDGKNAREIAADAEQARSSLDDFGDRRAARLETLRAEFDE